MNIIIFKLLRRILMNQVAMLDRFPEYRKDTSVLLGELDFVLAVSGTMLGSAPKGSVLGEKDRYCNWPRA